MALLFDRQGNFKYRRIPRASYFLPDFQLTDAHWDALLIPISMAFFFQSTPSERVVAMYPSPAGATESLLTLDAWNSLVADNPLLNEMQPDVEALLVNRLGAMRGFPDAEYYQAPIDECYKLVGLTAHALARPLRRQRSVESDSRLFRRPQEPLL